MLRKMFQGGSSRKQGPRLAMCDADDEPPRDAPVRPCEWPSENFMDRAGIKEEFNAYLRNADLVSFEEEKCSQYHNLTSTIVRRFEFSTSHNSPTVLFDLYENSYTMDLKDFTTACKLPQWGSIRDPRKYEFRDLLASITVEESRDITQATIGSIHFPAIHYFALFIGRCINGKDEACHMCVPDLGTLRSAVLGDKSYNLGAIVARRLHLNRFNGDFFGGIYATRIANFLGIAIREDDIELPPAYLDFNAMVHHQFVERNESPLQYRLIFDRRRAVHITLPASAFFDHQAKGRYTITREEADEYERRAEAARRHDVAQQAIAVASQYDPSYYYGYPPGQPWP